MATVKKYLYFDNVNLASYGMYITGEAVYNAPERDVEYVSIPGRNGDYVIDNGRFRNIEVVYPAGIYDVDQSNFATRIAEIRNIFASRKGKYVKIQDEYNPSEYRMGMFVSGLEVKPACGGIAGEFELHFICKPQRFLTSGDTKVSVASGGTMSNTTLFDASPLIEVVGSGDMSINGYDISITGGNYGTIELLPQQNVSTQYDIFTFNGDILNTGNTLTTAVSFSDTVKFDKTATTWTQGTVTGSLSLAYVGVDGYDYMTATFTTYTLTLTKGTSTTQTANITGTVTFDDSTTASLNYTCTFTYDGDSHISISISRSTSGTVQTGNYFMQLQRVEGNSTQSILGNPIYIDCDLGECYKIESGTYIPLNAYIDLGTYPPVLSPGTNTITYDNTYTSVKITPRWWQV